MKGFSQEKNDSFTAPKKVTENTETKRKEKMEKGWEKDKVKMK